MRIKTFFIIVGSAFLIFIDLNFISMAETSKNPELLDEKTREELIPSENIKTTTVEKKSVQISKNFLDKLRKKKYITYQDAFTAFLMIKGEIDSSESFSQKKTRLSKNNSLPPGINDPSAGKYITKGESAFILMRIFNIKGGVLSHFGHLNTRRAFNELVFRGIMWRGFWQEPISGYEFVWALNKAAEQYMANMDQN